MFVFLTVFSCFLFVLQIQLNFDSFQLERPYDCDSNFIDIFSDKTDIPSRDKNFCGSVAEAIPSKHNVMFLRFFAESKSMKSNFKATFTAYRETDKAIGKDLVYN